MPHPREGRLGWLSVGLLLLSLSVAGPAAAEPLKIRYSVWVGYGPLFLAQEKGYFEEEKVEVQHVNIEDPQESFSPMGAGRLDGIVSTIDTMVLYLKTGRDFSTSLRSTTPRAATASSRPRRSSRSGT